MNPKVIEDFSAALGKFLSAVSKSLENGWDPMTDLPDLVVEAVKDFAPVIGDLIGKQP